MRLFSGLVRQVGLVRRVADLLVSQPPTSPYYFEGASTLHKWLQVTAPRGLAAAGDSGTLFMIENLEGSLYVCVRTSLRIVGF